MKQFYNKDGNEINRTPCQVYTRVMGYLRPVSHYNIGKKSEFYSRKYFDESKLANSEFIRHFATDFQMNTAYDSLLGYENKVEFVGCGCEK